MTARQLLLPGFRSAALQPPRAPRPAPCVLCERRRCHECRRNPDGGRFPKADAYFMPFCDGGAIQGPGSCYCWPETPRARARREEARARELGRDFRRNMARWSHDVENHRRRVAALQAGHREAVKEFLADGAPELPTPPMRVLPARREA